MRKNTRFAVAATIMGLAMIFWAKSSVDATSADIARPKLGLSSYIVVSGSYLPLRAIEPIY